MIFHTFIIAGHMLILAIVFYPVYLGAKEELSRLVKK